ncbi:DUF2063 domain-containing protein [Microbulbifer sp. TYP-18]|uniref:HvfC family RiPP maturation protein n=1 Tax=Microbulbifer sp. TYP-18 TaxID=3230024 RepID=UPI0034C5B27C
MPAITGKAHREAVGRPGDFKQAQREFAAHLRAPDEKPAPTDIEDRRLGIYRDLIYNNIENFVASGFPILRSIYSDPDWHAMVRDFVHRHASESPYFLQISEEFLHYLQSERDPQPCDPPFLLELAHYEWVELALDVSDAEFPADLSSQGDILDSILVVSPLVWSLNYRFPVHQLGPSFQPKEAPEQATFLLVYRNRKDKVGFMEANAVTARLLQLARAEELSGRELIEAVGREMQHPDPEALLGFGRDLLEKLMALDIIAGLNAR